MCGGVCVCGWVWVWLLGLINDLLIRLCTYDSPVSVRSPPPLCARAAATWLLLLTCWAGSGMLGERERETEPPPCCRGCRCHLVTPRTRQSAVRWRCSALTSSAHPSPPRPFSLTQDLPPGQEQLPAGLRGRRRDGRGGEAAAPDAGSDSLLFFIKADFSV